MFPFLRMAKVVGAATARAPLAPLDESVVSFRVWPGDLDNNGHMNNGRFLTMMDLGRWDIVTRTGLLKVLVKRRMYPVVSAATIRYRRSLDAFQRYELRTRILGWDDKGFYVEHRFEREGETHALAVIKGVFLGPAGKVAPADIVELMQPGTPSPPLPAWVATWERALGEMRSG